ncbi:hypothetical protein CJ030_MR0G007932 [Morella rubra]|uniref:TRF2/HOY1 PH-like domain-containing protein n=1 Tax=Morella rubra TaxID=262757 RepID=A0A6A1ULY3_9ROSI|nr:hypothetical protein CJ030_MR0G007932 [Morella rubra]
MPNGGLNSSNGEHYGYSAWEQFQNPPLDTVNNNRDMVSVVQTTEAAIAKELLIGTPADTEVQITEAANELLIRTPADTAETYSRKALLLCQPPIGLKLLKTDSFLDWVDSPFYHANRVAETSRTACHGGVLQPNVNNSDSEMLKVSNFRVSFLEIGSWKAEVGRSEDSLAAKCFYSKKTFAWEIMKEGLKNRIEIRWSDIILIRFLITEFPAAILVFKLNNPRPTFYQEAEPMSRNHTIWNVIPDFTDGQALICTTHFAEFPQPDLDENYEELLKCILFQSSATDTLLL